MLSSAYTETHPTPPPPFPSLLLPQFYVGVGASGAPLLRWSPSLYK